MIARLLALVLLTTAAGAQARYAGIAPGTYIAVGATWSSFDTDYGRQRTSGAALFLDTNLYRRIGAELEYRAQPIAPQPLAGGQNQPGTRVTTFLAGPKLSARGRTWRPYAKLLAGRGTFTFPFNYGQGTYFVAAPGAGLDWRPPAHLNRTGDLSQSRLLVRLIDLEYQIWPNFTFGPLHPYGLSTGLSYRLY